MFAALAKFIQLFIDAIAFALGALVHLFPKSPFTFIYNSQYSDLIAQINYFLPINEFVAITQAWTVAVGVYYAYSVYARFVKAID